MKVWTVPEAVYGGRVAVERTSSLVVRRLIPESVAGPTVVVDGNAGTSPVAVSRPVEESRAMAGASAVEIADRRD